MIGHTTIRRGRPDFDVVPKAGPSARMFDARHAADRPDYGRCTLTLHEENVHTGALYVRQWVIAGRGLPARYIYSVPEGRGFGRWTWYDFLALSLMIRGVLSPGSETRVDC